MNQTLTEEANQQIVNSIVSLAVNCVTALVVLCMKFFDKKTMNNFLKSVDAKNSEIIEKLSNGGNTSREIYNEPITPSDAPTQQKSQHHIIPLDTNRNLIIKPK